MTNLQIEAGESEARYAAQVFDAVADAGQSIFGEIDQGGPVESTGNRLPRAGVPETRLR